MRNSSFDLEKIRNDTPGTGNSVHFNNAGSSLMAYPTYKAYMAYQEEEWKEGGYETMVSRAGDLSLFYKEAAILLNCTPGEIAFTDSATTSWQRVFFGINWKDGDEIITANAEYASNYISFLRLQKLFKIKIRVASDTAAGEVDIGHLESLINSRTRLIAITHMPTLSGLVNPVEQIGQLASNHKILYLVDACQSIGQIPLDVNKIQCDFLSGTGRKYLRGPRGTGILFVRQSAVKNIEPLSIDLYSARWMSKDQYVMRKDALRFETFESNMAAKAGLARAIQYQNEINISITWDRIMALALSFRTKLASIDKVSVHDRGTIQSGIVTLSVEGKSSAEVQEILSKASINVSFGSVFNSRLYMDQYGLKELLRASIHYFNTEEEIEQTCECLKAI